MASHRGGVAGDTREARQALTDARLALESTFGQAVASCGLVEHHRLVAGHGIRLQFAGDALVEPVLTALDHLPVVLRQDALKVCIWDTASTGTTLPANPLIPARAEMTTGPLFRSGDMSFLLQHGDRALSLLDEVAATAFYCLPDADPSVHHRGMPLRTVFSWWLQRFGCHLIHSGAVGLRHGAALVTGPAGAGKSTATLACAAGGMHYLGDDYVAVQAGPAVVHSLYRSAKLDRNHRERHPSLLSAVVGRPEEKALGFLEPGGDLALPIRAIVLPTVTDDRRSSVQRTTRGKALLALAPSTVLQVPGAAAASLRAMREVTASVPVYELRLGTDLDDVCDLVRGTLEAQ